MCYSYRFQTINVTKLITMPSLPETFIFQTVEMLLNGAIARDKHSRTLLKGLNGKSFEFFFTDTRKTLGLIFFDSRITIRNSQLCEINQLPDVKISASSLNFADLLLARDKTKKIANKKFELNGDANLANQLYSVVEKIDFRWDDFFTLIAGDVVTNEISGINKEIKQFNTEGLRRLAHSLDDFISEELRLTPIRERIDTLGEAIDNLRLRLDRAEAKISYVSRKLQQKNALKTA